MNRLLSILCCIALLVSATFAQDNKSAASLDHCKIQRSFVYVANDNFPDAFTVSAFRVNRNGSLTEVLGSPFLTGGASSDVFGVEEMVVAGSLLIFNDGNVMRINRRTGVLTHIADAGPLGNANHIAVAPDNRTLISVSNPFKGEDVPTVDILTFHIAADGTLNPLSQISFSANVAAQPKFTPDGKYVVVVMNETQIVVLSLGNQGVLTQVPGSPFVLPSVSPLGAFDFDCSSRRMFIAGQDIEGHGLIVVVEANEQGQLEVASTIALPSGVGARDVTLSPGARFLFASSTDNTIRTFAVGRSGSLTEALGSPFPTPGVFGPSLLEVTASGRFLYASDANPNGDGTQALIDGFALRRRGSLAAVPGSPFVLPSDPNALNGSTITDMKVYPAKTCSRHGHGSEK